MRQCSDGSERSSGTARTHYIQHSSNTHLSAISSHPVSKRRLILLGEALQAVGFSTPVGHLVKEVNVSVTGHTGLSITLGSSPAGRRYVALLQVSLWPSSITINLACASTNNHVWYKVRSMRNQMSCRPPAILDSAAVSHGGGKKLGRMT
jgi:hypothetical protein